MSCHLQVSFIKRINIGRSVEGKWFVIQLVNVFASTVNAAIFRGHELINKGPRLLFHYMFIEIMSSTVITNVCVLQQLVLQTDAHIQVDRTVQAALKHFQVFSLLESFWEVCEKETVLGFTLQSQEFDVDIFVVDFFLVSILKDESSLLSEFTARVSSVVNDF